MVGLVPPSQELGRSRTALPPFPSRLPCLSLLSLCPYCITIWAVCQVLQFSEMRKDTWRETRGSFSCRAGLRRIGVPLLRNWQGVFCRVSFPQQIVRSSAERNVSVRVSSSLCAFIVSQLGRFVKGFFAFFFEPAQDRSLTRLLQSPRGKDTRLKVCTSLPLTMIVYHRPHQKSTWQSAQIRASKLFDFCTTFLLTNCWRYAIMWMLEEDLHLYKSPGNFCHQSNRVYHNLAQAKGADLSAPIMLSAAPKHRNFPP